MAFAEDFDKLAGDCWCHELRTEKKILSIEVKDHGYCVSLGDNNRLYFHSHQKLTSYQLVDPFDCYMVQGPHLYVVTVRKDRYHDYFALTRFSFDPQTGNLTYNSARLTKSEVEGTVYYVTSNVDQRFNYFEKNDKLLIPKPAVDFKAILSGSADCNPTIDEGLEIFKDNGEIRLGFNCYLSAAVPK